MFIDNSYFLNARAKVIYPDDSKSIINQYITYTKVIKEQIEIYGRTEKAVREAIKICKNRDILREYLSQKEKEVVSMTTYLFDQEENNRTFEASIRKEERDRYIRAWSKKGKNPQEIADIMDMDVDDVERILASRTANAV